MTFKQIDTFLLSKKGASYDYPFDDKVRVYREEKKIYALMSHELPLRINLKCDPIYALELRSLYTAVTPGYHMNKKHWNTLNVEGDVDETLLKELMNHSYTLIVKSLTKKQQSLLLDLN